MDPQQTAGSEPGQEHEVGWQDTDSEGVVNEWQLEGMETEEEEQPAAEQQPLAAQQPLQPLLLQQQDPQQDGSQHGAHQYQQQQQQQEEPEHALPPHRPLHRHIAALIHRRVQALLHQTLAAGTEADDAAALQELLHGTADLAGGAAGGEADGGSSSAGDGSSDGGSSSSSSSNMPTEEMDEEDGADEGCTQFDPNVTASHQYLGDVDELEGGYGHLQPGTTARLPLLLLDGVVLFPGCQLPLLLSTVQEQHLLDRALAAPPPLTRLLAVLPGPRSALTHLPQLVCCTAEVRQMRRQEEAGAVAVLALGRQRAQLVEQQQHVARSQSSVLVCILPEGCQTDVPQPMRCYASAIHPALTAPWDLRLLVERVRQLIRLVLMPVASFQGTPLELSYWISHNLPLQPSTRQMLLTARSPADRLLLLLGLLEGLDQLGCSSCGSLLATTADVLAMTSEGIAGTFVNSHGYVHEMVTFKRVRGIHLEGQPETAHSWFPGYAWTIAYCHTCGQHLGWRFSAVEQGLAPRVFWGLRRPVLTCSSNPRARGQHGAGAGVLGGGGRLVIQLGQLPVRVAAVETGQEGGGNEGE